MICSNLGDLSEWKKEVSSHKFMYQSREIDELAKLFRVGLRQTKLGRPTEKKSNAKI
jgi:hypothetical protein